ncbi:MAG: hypothetical protein BWY22_02279 [Bacteroidetes bacterium ADurb.Bin217]|nr:MAG: hypothetical protein BWY22_02279 [Bacteroidetes bacterium ADurb.Bin217]
MVEGIGAVVDPVPPVAVVYHLRAVPVAVRAEAVAPLQCETVGVTVGAAGQGGAPQFTIFMAANESFLNP